jgi:iron complex transport system permease protein
LFLCLLFSLAWAVSLGSTQVDAATVWRVIFWKTVGIAPQPWKVDEAAAAIVWEIRLPRVLLAALTGGILATAGTVYQGILRNPLADPYILGISSGAALGAALAILGGAEEMLGGSWAVPFFSFAGASLALALVLTLAQAGRSSGTESLILSGVVVQAFFGAALLLALSFAPQEMQRVQFWLMGSFGLRQWEHVAAMAPFAVSGFPLCWFFARELNLFALGERTAFHLGVSVLRVRLFLLLVASMMTGAAVAVSGMIGFVGLVVPHVIRMLAGGDHRRLLPLSFLAGAIFLVWADVLARTVIKPAELPIGVITAFVGAPFFAFLLRRRMKRGEVG